MTAQQSDALREIANKARVTTILQSKAWKDTQRILQRSGLVYRGEQSEPFDPEKHFDCYTVRYLYQLNIIALELRSDTRIKVEVGQWYRMTGKRLSLNVPPFMLIQRNIRRKVDGFRQSEGKTTKKPTQPFTGSLYEVLSRDIDSAKLDAWIAEPPLTPQEVREGRRVTDFNPWALSSFICRSASPTFELFYQEYKRLGLKSLFVSGVMFEQFLTGLSFRKYGYRVESQLLESLGNVMFFMLLYDMENLDKFIEELMNINVQSEDSKEKGKSRKERMLECINSYIRDVYGSFLCTSKERYEQHKRKNSSKKKNCSGGTH
ncbi:hypothetical protein GDC75_12015 [Escherichia coli]|uniref:hypothetical protein n=1 Tax=Enterobacteriaceae TaxID=543 RepID=UPI0002A25053|nr:MULTISPECIES: hypothetical protein [Enterobacteriaceae]EET3009593.1 hypothetical protein [Escherichia coli]EEY5824443.1 hypothetical protein [Escherichia coli]EEY5839147.1 hypothetical protein [Escherichia coli]EEZ6835970.1 hypothetical protein [Escherichia coli]EFA4517996.1 hypothetical protein [Escherichia coli]